MVYNQYKTEFLKKFPKYIQIPIWSIINPQVFKSVIAIVVSYISVDRCFYSNFLLKNKVFLYHSL